MKNKTSLFTVCVLTTILASCSKPVAEGDICLNAFADRGMTITDIDTNSSNTNSASTITIAKPATTPVSMILLDASGSMFEPPNKDSVDSDINICTTNDTDTYCKINQATDIIADFVANPENKNIKIGLTTFGNDPTQGENCSQDVAIQLEPLEEGDRQKKIATINEEILSKKVLNNSPIYDAIQKVADHLVAIKDKYPEKYGKYTIILITDGLENCIAGSKEQRTQKILDLIKNLNQQQNMNFKLHVIGYGTNSDISEQLQQIATAGNGQFINVNRDTNLEKELEKLAVGFGYIQVNEPDETSARQWRLYNSHNDNIVMSVTESARPWQPKELNTGEYRLCVIADNGATKTKKVTISDEQTTFISY